MFITVSICAAFTISFVLAFSIQFLKICLPVILVLLNNNGKRQFTDNTYNWKINSPVMNIGDKATLDKAYRTPVTPKCSYTTANI